MVKVFVDGQEGTTGLKIHERLAGRSDLQVLQIDPEQRKDPKARAELLNASDVSFLCLPDAASKEAAVLTTNPKTCLIDASTAHRVDPAWVYGLPELSSEHRSAVAKAKRITNPGCHATGFNILVFPLVKEGIASANYPFTCHSITGYSGGGKKLIASYENPTRKNSLKCPRLYGLGLKHKHLPEMQHVAGLAEPPVFDPICGDFYQGMAVSVPLHTRLLAKKMPAKALRGMFAEYYHGQRFVDVKPYESDAWLEEGFFDPMACNNTNRLEIFVFGHDTQILLVARFDNLGKGASGAAVQSMNIMLGMDEGLGL